MITRRLIIISFIANIIYLNSSCYNRETQEYDVQIEITSPDKNNIEVSKYFNEPVIYYQSMWYEDINKSKRNNNNNSLVTMIRIPDHIIYDDIIYHYNSISTFIDNNKVPVINTSSLLYTENDGFYYFIYKDFSKYDKPFIILDHNKIFTFIQDWKILNNKKMKCIIVYRNGEITKTYNYCYTLSRRPQDIIDSENRKRFYYGISVMTILGILVMVT